MIKLNRNFNDWLAKFKDSIATWKYYTDFDKVYKKVNEIKNEINLLNSLVGSKNIEKDFKELIDKNPKVLNVIPILIAKREKEIIIKDAEKDYNYKFNKMNYTTDDYVKFMRKTGIFDLLENHLISNLFDYIIGIEVGMDTHGRKTRTGDAMEDLVESYIVKSGYIKNSNYFKEMTTKQIKDKWNIDLTTLESGKKAEKKFDFVIKKDNTIYLIETNFYAAQGSKLNETARSYKMLNEELKDIEGIKFVWFTDGKGWENAKHNLEETFNEMEMIYNIDDLENGILETIIK